MKIVLLCAAVLLTGCASIRPDCLVQVVNPFSYAASVVTCIAIDTAVEAARPPASVDTATQEE